MENKSQFGQFLSIEEASAMFETSNQYDIELENVIENSNKTLSRGADRYYRKRDVAFVYDKKMLQQLLDRVDGDNDAIMFYPASREDANGDGRTTLIAVAYKKDISGDYSLIMGKGPMEHFDALEHTGGDSGDNGGDNNNNNNYRPNNQNGDPFPVPSNGSIPITIPGGRIHNIFLLKNAL